MSHSGHHWVDEEARPPLDLRLMLPAAATWAGCLGALLAPGASRWMILILGGALAGGLIASFAACAVTRARSPMRAAVRRIVRGGRRPRHQPHGAGARFPCFGDGPRTRAVGAAVAVVGIALACMLAAVIRTTIMVDAARADPMFVAAESGARVAAEVVVSGDPQPISDPWGGDPRDPTDIPIAGGPMSAEADTDPAARKATRWRIKGHAELVTVRGQIFTSRAEVTMVASGSAWAGVGPGQRVAARGIATVDSFGIVPTTSLRVREPPTVLADAPWWSAWALRARVGLADAARVLDTDRGGLLRGLTVGDTRGIDAVLTADAKASGLTHLVAVSGSHLAVIAAAVLVFARRFGPRVCAVAVASTFLALVVLVGPGPSVLRAVVMGLIGVLAGVLGRSTAALSSLFGAIFVLLLIDPSMSASLGFAMSVLATGGLVLLAPPLVRALVRRRVPRGWAVLLAMPIAAHLATVPAVLPLSGTISLAAIPANILVAPAVAPALLIGLCCLVVGMFWPAAAEVIAEIDGPLLGWIAGTAHRAANWPWATLPWGSSGMAVAVLVACVIAVIILFQYRRARVILIVAALAAAATVGTARISSYGWPIRGWLIAACDVGQGDGIVLSTGNPGEVVVVDTGPAGGDIGSCLSRLGARTIALVLITHLHADHVGGLAEALAGRTVAAIAVGPDRSSPTALRTITDLASARNIPILPLHPGMEMTMRELHLDVLGPRREFHGSESDPNNDSVVVRATHDGVTMLLTGDIERAAQQSLLDSGVDLRAEVLKQPHHGSSVLLPEFVEAVGASVALIGVGAGNDYGHPSDTALRIDAQAGIGPILRTDTDGDVLVALEGGELVALRRGAQAAP